MENFKRKVGIVAVCMLLMNNALYGGFETEIADQWEEDAKAYIKKYETAETKGVLLFNLKQQVGKLKKQPSTVTNRRKICELEKEIALLERRYTDSSAKQDCNAIK